METDSANVAQRRVCGLGFYFTPLRKLVYAYPSTEKPHGFNHLICIHGLLEQFEGRDPRLLLYSRALEAIEVDYLNFRQKRTAVSLFFGIFEWSVPVGMAAVPRFFPEMLPGLQKPETYREPQDDPAFHDLRRLALTTAGEVLTYGRPEEEERRSEERRAEVRQAIQAYADHHGHTYQAVLEAIQRGEPPRKEKHE